MKYKIKIVTQVPKYTEFCCLNNGEVFKDVDGCTYMKISPIPIKEGVVNSANAVNISTGIIEDFYEGKKVARPDCIFKEELKK